MPGGADELADAESRPHVKSHGQARESYSPRRESPRINRVVVPGSPRQPTLTPRGGVGGLSPLAASPRSQAIHFARRIAPDSLGIQPQAGGLQRSSWRLCAGCSSPVKIDWDSCPRCNTERAAAGGSLKLGWLRCRKPDCASPVRSDWDVCPGCGTSVPISTLDVLDWDVCRQCLKALVRPNWHLCPGCGCSVPPNTSRLPLLMESGKALGPRSLREKAKESSPNGMEQEQVDAAFMLTTTPRYWEKRIKMLEMCKQQENMKPHINPYTLKDRIVTRHGGPMHGWTGLPHGYAPASLQRLSAYELPVPRKPGSLISRQSSFASACSTGASERSRRGASTVLRENSNAVVDMPSLLVRQSNSWSLSSPRRESNLASLNGEWSWSSSRSKTSVAPERQHMLHGHVMPGKLWRQNSTFKEMAKMRLALEAPELETSQEIMDTASNDLKDKAINDFQTRHRTESKRRMSVMHEGTEALTQDLRDLEAVEDLLEIRRDSSGGWYWPNGRCLHWTESQIRTQVDKENAKILHEQQFGVKSLAYRWRRFSTKVVNAMVSKTIKSIMANNLLTAILVVQKGVVRFLRVKRAREARSREWMKLHAAATKIQSRVRGITDRQYAKFVGKCKPFLDRNANVFATHKAFVRAKRAYTGTIEPPATATAFAFLGDANSANDKGDLTLTFVEFCHAINDHLRQAVLDPVLAQRTSSALNRASSGLMFGRMGSFGRIDSVGSGASQTSGMPQRTTSAVSPAAKDSIKPFEPSQDHVLLMAESTARLLYLYDDTRLGLLSERDFWSACREIHLSTGVPVSREDGKWALRYTRGQGGIALNMLCALQEIARLSGLPESVSVKD